MLHAGLATIGQNAVMKRATTETTNHCPCGAAAIYAKCCGRWHAGDAAPDAEKLMRSRYAAYAMKLDDYVLATWHESTRPHGLDKATASEKPSAPNFIRLEIKHHHSTGVNMATVEFVAWYKAGGRAFRMHEISRFVREHGRWWYLDGEVSDH